MGLCFTGKPPFMDWLTDIGRQHIIPYIKNPGPNDHIVPLCPDQHSLRNSIFRPVPSALKNKSNFAVFMANNFPAHIPKTLYHSADRTSVCDTAGNFPPGTCFILKPDNSFSGNGIRILDRSAAEQIISEGQKDIVISEFIEHERYWVGHFLTMDGKILYRVYFTAKMKPSQGKLIGNSRKDIKRGPIRGYTVEEEPSFDEAIFSDIFGHLCYSGITSIDFTVKDGKPILFEINPRPGGSLLKNTPYFVKMLEKLQVEMKIS